MVRMRIRGLLALTIACWLVPAQGVLAALKVVPKTTVVHVDSADIATLQGFLAAVPASVFHSNGERYQGVLLTDDVSSPSNQYLLEDWSTYLKSSGATSSLVFVGDVPAAVREGIAASLGTTQFSQVAGSDPSSLSLALAVASWQRSKRVVLAPSAASADAGDIENAANAAAYAAMVNAPLLYMKEGVLDQATLEVARKLGAKDCAIFDLKGRVNADVVRALGTAGLTPTFVAKEARDVVGNMLTLSGRSTVALFDGSARGLAAAVAAACYGGSVLRVPEELRGLAVVAEKSIPASLRGARKLSEMLRMTTLAKDETELADGFYTWLAGLGGEDVTNMETVLVFADRAELPPTLERSLVGDPRRPLDRGAIASRMPGNGVENVAYVNRTTLNRALIHANPRRGRMSMAMVAYECQNTGSGSTGPTRANDGKEHIVNEFWGCNDGTYADPGVYQSFKDRGFSVGFHSGRHADPESSDPINQETSWGIRQELEMGTAFGYYSGHGSEEAFYAMDEDNGIVADQEYGSEGWPSSSGRVNHSGPGYTSEGWHQDNGNLHGAGAAFNACLIGDGTINNVLLSHGGTFVVSNYISGSFDGGGYLFCVLAEQLATDGRSVGEAHAMALSGISEVFPSHRQGEDSSMRFVLYGDARMELAKPDWQLPAPVTSPEVGGHTL